MVHMASVWVPFTSESKEAIAALSRNPKGTASGAAGRRPETGDVLRRRHPRSGRKGNAAPSFCGTWAKWLRAVSEINGTDPEQLYERLLTVAKRKTLEADTQLDDRGKRVSADEQDFGDNVLIVEQSPEELLARTESNGAGTATQRAATANRI